MTPLARKPVRDRVVSRRQWWGFLFVLPVVVFFAIFSIYPIINGFYLSLTDFTLLRPPVYIGFENYRRIFTDRLFLDSLVVTIRFVAGTTLPVWVLSLAAAYVFYQKFAGRTLLRALFYSPVLPSFIVVAVVWKVLLHPNGFFTSIIGGLVGQGEIRWLNDVILSPLSMIVMNDWTTIPFFMLIWLAGMMGIPEEIREAATVDGANRLQSILKVELPLLRPTFVFIASMSMIQSFQGFILQYVISPDRGGPINVNTTLSLLIWKYGFQQFKMGQAAAVSVILCLIILGVTVLQLWWGRSEEHSLQ